ncbi:MAG: hypothetical protein CMI67_17915 [Pelagibaca sp.]|nr:hypothetical protein [Pelagibaca sp.]
MNFRYVPGIFLLSGLVACNGSDDADPVSEGRHSAIEIPVNVRSVSPQPVFDHYEFTGIVRSAQRAVIRTQISGRVEELPVRLGQKIASGDLIAELHNPEAAPAARSARVRWQQLNVQLEQQQRDFDRMNALYQSGQASRQEFEQARTALNSAKEAALGAENDYLKASGVNSERSIRAPFSGVVTAIITDVGEVVNPGQSVIQLASDEEYEVEITLPFAVAQIIEAGVEIPVRTSEGGGEFNSYATVKEISPFRDRGSLPSVVMTVPDVIAGETIVAQISVPKSDGWVVPVTAVSRKGERAVIYRLIDGGRVESVDVVLGSSQLNGVEVQGALESGDSIVISGVQRLFDQAQVAVSQ